MGFLLLGRQKLKAIFSSSRMATTWTLLLQTTQSHCECDSDCRCQSYSLTVWIGYNIIRIDFSNYYLNHFLISHRLSVVGLQPSSLLSTGCVVSLRGDWAIFCRAGSGQVGRVWSVREKSLEILRHDCEMYHNRDWTLNDKWNTHQYSLFIARWIEADPPVCHMTL